MGPLDGIRVLDLSSVIMGPFGTQLLGDLGADIVKVEDGPSDTSRHMGPGPARNFSGTSFNLHRNKRSIVLDLKHPDGRQAILDLARTCDVFVTNLRPGPLGRAGLRYEDVAAVRPDIVYCQAQGWRTTTDKADRPAYDDVIQTAAGIADLSERAGSGGALSPTLIADKVSGMTIAYGILGALFHRERTGQGQRLEVPMFDTALSWVLVEHLVGMATLPPVGNPGYQRILTSARRPHPSKDGFIAILPYSDAQWRAVLKECGQESLMDDPRFATAPARMANSADVYGALGAMIALKTNAEWIAFCEHHNVPCEASLPLHEIIERETGPDGAIREYDHPHFGAYRYVVPPVRFDRTPPELRHHAPLVGEHTVSLLREIGYDQERIARLVSDGAAWAAEGL